jgi:hypothetical protein
MSLRRPFRAIVYDALPVKTSEDVAPEKCLRCDEE